MRVEEAIILTHKAEMDYVLSRIKLQAEHRAFNVQIKTVNPFSEYVPAALSTLGYHYLMGTEKHEDEILYILDISWKP